MNHAPNFAALNDRRNVSFPSKPAGVDQIEAVVYRPAPKRDCRVASQRADAHHRSMEANPVIQDIRERANQIASQVTAIHPLVSKLADPPTQGELLKALYELTKQVEVVKKHLLKLERRDDSALL